MKTKLVLMAAMAATCLNSGIGQAVDNNEVYTLSTYYVHGLRDAKDKGFTEHNARVGIMGDKSVLDTPFTQYRFTSKSVEIFGQSDTGANSILLNSPAVKTGGVMTHNDFSIRGHYLQGGSFYVNGIPGLYSQMNAPTNTIEQVEIIAGPNVLGGVQMEKNAVAGTVNFVSKKAKVSPNLDVTFSYSGRNHKSIFVDWGKRFGRQQEFGVRVNTEYQTGETALKNSDNQIKGIFVNFDHTSEDSQSNLFMGHREQTVLRGMRWFSFDKTLKEIPKVPKLSNNVSFSEMKKREISDILAFNH